jgi:hypothetical protein
LRHAIAVLLPLLLVASAAAGRRPLGVPATVPGRLEAR